MIINQILALVWIVICCFWAFYIIRDFPRASNSRPESDRVPFRFLVTVFFLLALIGIAAGVLLFSGATWALWLLGIVAICNLFGFICTLVVKKRFTSFNAIEIISLVISAATLVLVIAWAANIFHL